MKKYLAQFLFLSLATLILTIPFLAFAQLSSGLTTNINSQLDSAAGGAYQTGQKLNPGQTIATITNYCLSFLMLISVLIIIYAGFTWMTAGGNDDKVAQAKSWIINSIIGLIIILAAYAISAFVFSFILDVTKGSSSTSEANDPCNPNPCSANQTCGSDGAGGYECLPIET
ncbi:MAG: hypothetical protein WCW02_03365 [Candidatus Buchananbacteria bacterium]